MAQSCGALNRLKRSIQNACVGLAMKRIIPRERLHALPGRLTGLSSNDVLEYRKRFGTNLIVDTPPSGWRELLKGTVRDPMLWFLLGTSLIFLLTGSRTEALVLLVALIPFLGMDAYLHRRTQASTAALSGHLAARTTVIRQGQKTVVDALDLVPGDLVEVRGGESFPADGILLAAETVQVDESALTGEAYPVRKPATRITPVTDADVAFDETVWGYAGTRLLTGNARLRVVFTGRETLYGEIVSTALGGRHGRTPLQRAVGRMVGALLLVALAFCILLAGVRLYQGHGLLDALISAVTLAVAALPEEFPVVLTFFLGVGVYRLAKRKALVRRAVVVENIGRVTTICSDKTGTLTEGRLELAHQYPAENTSRERLLAIAAAASRHDSGDPLDSAILQAAGERSTSKVIANFPFTEDRKRETTVLEWQGKTVAVVKGAPETILALCTLSATDVGAWQAQMQRLGAEGHKVIACAWRDGIKDAQFEPAQGFTFAGLLAFEDPIREGVRGALDQCRAAQIRVIMVTGDHPATARALAAEIGLGGTSPTLVTGDELTRCLAQHDQRVLREIDVVARAVPAQKHALVQSLQAQGELVAVTGDGVNDVPALQVADVGIAMGERGTRAAREVAAIVLMDDNFRTIVGAIAEGRQLFANLQQSFQYLLMVHIPLVVTAALIPLMGFPILYLPIHIVWLELIIHPTALLVFQDAAQDDVLRRGSSRGVRHFFSTREVVFIVMTGALVTALIYWSYGRSLGAGLDVEHARAMAIAALIFAGAGITAVLSRLRHTIAWLVTGSALLSAFVLIQVPSLSALLQLRPLHPDDWLVAGLGGAITCLPLLYERMVIHGPGADRRTSGL